MRYLEIYFTDFITLWVYLVISWLVAREYRRLWLIHDYPKYIVKYNNKHGLFMLRFLAFFFAFILPMFAIFDIMEYNGVLEKFRQFTKKTRKERY